MKNTIISNISELFCPHNCILCGKIGGILCECCKKYIACGYKKCLMCGKDLIENKCGWCELCGIKQYCVGRRKAALARLIEIYKYHSVRAVAAVLAGLADKVVPDGSALVPLPTIRRHIRERGYDHIGLIARKMRLPVEKVLVRNKNTVQVGASREERQIQAQEAYSVQKIDSERSYLLFDDVWTTGSSMMAAMQKLREAGAKKIGIAVIARS